MMKRPFLLMALGASLGLVPLSAHAALVCSAAVEDIHFGDISVADVFPVTTSATMSVSCLGGEANATLQLSVIGWKSRMLSADRENGLDYEGTSSSDFSFSLDENGQIVDFAVPLTVSIPSLGYDTSVGDYGAQEFLELTVCDTARAGAAGCDELTATSEITVKASVTASCTIDVSDMNFGTIAPVRDVAVDQTALISLICTSGTQYAIGLGAGDNYEGAIGRRMQNDRIGGQFLPYTLYRNSERSVLWNPDTLSPTEEGKGSWETIEVFGAIPPYATALAGRYLDFVVVTITY